MFCARCESKASENQKFCRSCGNRLQVAPPAIDQDPKISREGKNAITRAANEIRRLGKLTLAAALAVSIILWLIGGIIPIKTPEVFVNILLAIISVPLILITIGVFLKIVGLFIGPESDSKHDGRRVWAETPQTNQLVESPASISSVNEHTAKLLEDSVSESDAGRDRLSKKGRST